MNIFKKLFSFFKKNNSTATEELIAHYVPSLLYMLKNHEITKGSDLTKEEVIDICDQSICMYVTKLRKAELDKQAGYKDINPEKCWEEWCSYKNKNCNLKNVCTYPKIILESKSPNCPLAVIIEEDDTCTYMYLIHLKTDGTQSIICPLWIRNHQKAPDDLEFAKMQEGFSSMMPKEFCSHPDGKERFQPENLRCIWLEEGDGVALLENEQILAIIPGWANDKIPAYSIDCIKENSLAFPLTKDNVLNERIKKADMFWNSWDYDPWRIFLDTRLEILCKEFGQETKYYAIDGGQWPIKGMAQFEKGDTTYLVTIGVSLIPQPFIEQLTEEPEKLRRIELGLAIKTEAFNKNAHEICSFLSAQTTIPWSNLTWLGHGHTIECGTLFEKDNEFPFCVFINGKFISSLPQIEFELFRGDNINVLWLTPISESEFHLIKETNVDDFLSADINKKRTWIFGKNF